MEARHVGSIDRAPEPLGDEPSKRARRLRKRLEKLQQDAVRPPDSFERFRILEALVGEGRQLVELADHKARYALVILGVLNAGVFVVISRGHMIASLPPGLKPWLVGALFVYALLTLLFMLHAIDCLRPRRLGYADLLLDRPSLVFWDAIATTDLETYRQAWAGARMDQINAEVVLIAHRESRILDVKYTALGRLYIGLATLVILASLLVAVYAGFSTAAVDV